MTTYSNYSCTRIPVDGPPTRVRVSGSLLALLTYEYPGGYGLKWLWVLSFWEQLMKQEIQVNHRVELRALHEAARLLSGDTISGPTSSSRQTASLLSMPCHPESSWKETHRASFVTCCDTARSLSSGSLLTVGSQEARRQIMMPGLAANKSSPT